MSPERLRVEGRVSTQVEMLKESQFTPPLLQTDSMTLAPCANVLPRVHGLNDKIVQMKAVETSNDVDGA
jgi:hypothetical protein